MSTVTRVLCFVLGTATACGVVRAPEVAADAGPDATLDAVPSASATLELPRYLDLGQTESWQAEIAGPPGATIHYAWQITPSAGVMFSPANASSALDATGKLTLTGTVASGATPTTANCELDVMGEAAGSASSSIEVAAFESFGYRLPFAQSSDTTLNAGRVLAVPFTMTSGVRVIAFGLRTASIADVRLGIYGSTGAEPADLLLASPVISTSPGETVSFLDTPQLLTATVSYIALVSNTDLEIAVDSNAADAVPEFASDITVASPLPSRLSQTTSFTGGPTNVFVIAFAP
jgi:hypothetical protein